MLSSSRRVTRGLDLPLEEVGHLLVEDLRRRRVAHVVALGVVLRGVDVGGGDALLLDPEAVDVVLEAQPGREERRQAERVVVAGHAAVHPPVLLGHHRAEVDQHVHVVQVVQASSAPRRRGTSRRSRWRRCRWCRSETSGPSSPTRRRQALRAAAAASSPAPGPWWRWSPGPSRCRRAARRARSCPAPRRPACPARRGTPLRMSNDLRV